MSYLDFWSAADKDKAPDSSNDTIHIQPEHRLLNRIKVNFN